MSALPPFPRGLPVGGGPVPYIPSAPSLRAALEKAVARFGADPAALRFPSPTEADPATITALNTLVNDFAEVPPVSDPEPDVLGAFGRAVGLGWAIGATLLGGVHRYSGDEEGGAAEWVPALLARSTTYDRHEIGDGLAEVGLLAGTRSTREDPAALQALTRHGRLTEQGDIEHLTVALVGGLGIACAEFEFLEGAVDRGPVAHVECDHGPHHHRFDYLTPIAMAHGDDVQLVYRCIRSTCRVMVTAPPVGSHEHRFAVDGPQLSFEGRSLRRCGHRGCGVLGEP